MFTKMATITSFAGLFIAFGVWEQVDGQRISCSGFYPTWCYERTMECINGTCVIVKTPCPGFSCRLVNAVCCSTEQRCCPRLHTCCGTGACCTSYERCCGGACIDRWDTCPFDSTSTSEPSQSRSSQIGIYLLVIFIALLIPGCTLLWVCLRRCKHRQLNRRDQPSISVVGPINVNNPGQTPPTYQQNMPPAPNTTNPTNPYSATFNRMYGPDAYMYVPPPDPPSSAPPGPVTEHVRPPPAYSTLYPESHPPDMTSKDISTNASRDVVSDIHSEGPAPGKDPNSDADASTSL